MTDLDASFARINSLVEQLTDQRDEWKRRAMRAERVIEKIRPAQPDLVEMAEIMVRQERGE